MGLFGPPNVKKLEAKRDVPRLIKALFYHREAWQDVLLWGSGVSRAASEALVRIGDPRAVEPLASVLNEPHGYGRRNWAAEALAEFDDERATQALIYALRGGGYGRGLCAAKALAKIGEPVVDRVTDVYKGDSNSIGSPTPAAIALGMIGGRAIEPLFAGLEDQDGEVRKAAAAGLEKSGWTPDDDRARAVYLVAKGAWDDCAELGTPAVEPLIAVLRSPGENRTRKHAAETLGSIKDARAVEPLVERLRSDVNPNVRDAACAALVRIGAPAVEPLMAALQEGGYKEYGELAAALENESDKATVIENFGLPEKILPEQRRRALEVGVYQRGGLSEPYCSDSCWRSAASYALVERIGLRCSVCGSAVTNCAVVPYQKRTLVVCEMCAPDRRTFFSYYRRCSYCDKELSA